MTQAGEVDRAIPRGIRIIAWFWLFAAALGFVGSVIEFVQALRDGGTLNIALPVGVGLSGWALGRGLLRGKRRAWLWTRRLAFVLPLVLAIGIALMMAFPEGAQLSFPGGTRSVRPWDSLVLLPGTGLVLFFCWQFVVLNRPETRQFYDAAQNA